MKFKNKNKIKTLRISTLKIVKAQAKIYIKIVNIFGYIIPVIIKIIKTLRIKMKGKIKLV